MRGRWRRWHGQDMELGDLKIRPPEDWQKLLEKPCWIMDILPEKVGRDAEGQFFDVECFFLNNGRRFGRKERLEGVILKLMCYYQTSILWDGWICRPSPEVIDEAIGKIVDDGSGVLHVLFPKEQTLLVLDGDSLNLAVYNPSKEFKALGEKIAWSEGLFWRKAGM